ncbi:MAG: glycoside hydrolase family 2 [Bryobacterales bacterium]|nr:glycoside hydrolase family 2 [Bryobacterales bacterium]
MKLSTLLLFSLPLLAAVPRPEYPQPQFKRAQWMTLNGEWEFDFDDRDEGLTANWQTAKPKFSRTIQVPYAFEAPLSGIGDTTFHPWVWYRRAFTVPADWKGRRVLLHFGAVDYRASVWVNGQLVGSHEGGNVPFRFDVTALAKPGAANTVVLRAEDPPTDKFIPRGKQYWQLKSRGIFYTRTSGIWQSVWLEATGDSYLESVRATANMDGLAKFEARVARGGEGLELAVDIKWDKQTAAQGSAKLIGPAGHLALRVQDPKLWSHTAPNLYPVTYELRRGTQVLDRVESYIGFRTVAWDNGRFYLNGRPTYLKMVLDQGYWPESLLTPPTEEAIIKDIEWTKEMGFNGARKHQKVEDPVFLYHADRLGLLVSDEMANAYDYDATYAARFTREWLEVVERDYSHPSVIMWVPINESWGVPNLRDPAQQNHLRSLYMLTKSLDTTRPVVDNDGWEHVETMDLFTIHDYTGTGDKFYAKYKDLGKPGVRIPDNARAILLPGVAYNGSPFLLSEFGGIAYVLPGSKVPSDAWGYAGVEKSPDAVLARLRGLYEAIAKIPAIAGICYTQLTDVEQEVNGLLSYDRKMKFDPTKLREINALLQ